LRLGDPDIPSFPITRLPPIARHLNRGTFDLVGGKALIQAVIPEIAAFPFDPLLGEWARQLGHIGSLRLRSRWR